MLARKMGESAAHLQIAWELRFVHSYRRSVVG